MNSKMQMSSLMSACYHGDLTKVQEILTEPLSDKDIYNSLIMCKEGQIYCPENENHEVISIMILNKHPNKIIPDSGRYAQSVLFDYRGPRVRYNMYVNGNSLGLVT